VKGFVLYIVTLVAVALSASIGVAVALFVDRFVGGPGGVLGAFFALVSLAVMGKGLRHLFVETAFEQAHLEALGPVPPGGGAPRRCVWS